MSRISSSVKLAVIKQIKEEGVLTVKRGDYYTALTEYDGNINKCIEDWVEKSHNGSGVAKVHIVSNEDKLRLEEEFTAFKEYKIIDTSTPIADFSYPILKSLYLFADDYSVLCHIDNDGVVSGTFCGVRVAIDTGVAVENQYGAYYDRYFIDEAFLDDNMKPRTPSRHCITTMTPNGLYLDADGVVEYRDVPLNQPPVEPLDVDCDTMTTVKSIAILGSRLDHQDHYRSIQVVGLDASAKNSYSLFAVCPTIADAIIKFNSNMKVTHIAKSKANKMIILIGESFSISIPIIKD